MTPDARHFESLVAKAAALHGCGRLAEAAAAYRAALALSPRHAIVLHNLGVIAALQGDAKGAVRHFDAALNAAPAYLPAHLHRAMACQALGETSEAIKSYERVCQLDPAHYGAHRALGFLWLADGNSGRALDHFARTYELRRGEDQTNIAAPSLTQASRDKLAHDAAQFRYLAAQGRGRARFSDLASRYELLAESFPETPTALSERQIEDLGSDYNTAIHIHDAPELANGVLAPRPERHSVVATFRDSRAAAVVLDDLLTPAALRALRTYLLRSTIWHDFTHIPGFVAAYVEDGLACPLFLQIADEIRRTFPEILADHPLAQAWAFKGLHADSAIGPHVDDGFVSVNFWITPNPANLNPDASGLAVCLEPPPGDWAMQTYGEDEGRSARFLDEHADKLMSVAYRENRAVLFHSRLFHKSEAPMFAAGYENHRINLTFLYGTGPRQEAGRSSPVS
jgi:Flp pilus assembly protein TadD